MLYDRELREFRKSNSSKTVAPTPTTFLSLAQSRKQHTHEQLQQQRVRHQQAYGGGGGDRDDDDGDIDRKTHWIFKNPYQNVEKRDMSRQSEGNLAYEVTTNQGIHLKQNCSEEAAEDKAKGEGKEGEEGKGKEKEKGDAVSKGKVMTKCGGAGAGQPTIKNSDSGKSGAPTAAAEKEKEKEGEKKTTEGKEGEKINTSSSASTAKGRQDSEGGHKRRKGIMAGIHGSFRDGAGFDPSDIGVNAPDFPPCCNVCRPSHAGGGCCVPCDDGFDFRHDD